MPSLPSPPSISFFSSCPSSLEMPFLSCQSLTPFCHGQHSWDTNNKKRAQITTKKGENGIRERLQRNNWSTKEYQEWKEGDCGWIDYLVCKPSAMKRDWLSCSALSSSLSSCSEGKSSVDTRGVSTLRSQRHVRWREKRDTWRNRQTRRVLLVSRVLVLLSQRPSRSSSSSRERLLVVWW